MQFKSLPKILKICGYIFCFLSLIVLFVKAFLLLKSGEPAFFIFDTVLYYGGYAVAGLIFIGTSRFFEMIIDQEPRDNRSEDPDYDLREDSVSNEMD